MGRGGVISDAGVRLEATLRGWGGEPIRTITFRLIPLVYVDRPDAPPRFLIDAIPALGSRGWDSVTLLPDGAVARRLNDLVEEVYLAVEEHLREEAGRDPR